MQQGGPARDFARGIQEFAHGAGQAWHNFAHSVSRALELDEEAAERWIRRRQQQGSSQGQGFGVPLAGLVFSRRDRQRRVRDVSGGDGRLVQDVQDAREARIVDAERRNVGVEVSQQLGSVAAAAATGMGMLVVPQDAEVESRSGNAVSKEELGRATWTFLHTLAAQFPEKPTRQQQRDVKELMLILSRMYPCKVCADHFKDVLKTNPVQAGSGTDLAQWMCRVHNVVNRSLGKTQFPCRRVDARWGALECDEGACDLEGRIYRK